MYTVVRVVYAWYGALKVHDGVVVVVDDGDTAVERAFWRSGALSGSDHCLVKLVLLVGLVSVGMPHQLSKYAFHHFIHSSTFSV